MHPHFHDVEELLAARGIEVDHVTVYRWVQRFTRLLVDAARSCPHAVVRVGSWTRPSEGRGRWRFVYRAIDQHGQIIDVYVSPRRASP